MHKQRSHGPGIVRGEEPDAGWAVQAGRRKAKVCFQAKAVSSNQHGQDVNGEEGGEIGARADLEPRGDTVGVAPACPEQPKSG